MSLAVGACGEPGLPDVSDTRPSQDARILEASDRMSDGRPTPVHITTTLETSIPIVSTGVVGGMTVSDDGAIYTANFDTSVWRTGADGETVLLTDAFEQASGNYALENGQLLQSDYKENKIYLVQSDGARRVFSETGLDGPVGITRRSNGDFIVANHRGKYLARIAAGGGAAERLIEDERMAHPNGVVADANDDIFISDLGGGDVFKLSADNELTILTTLPGRGNAHAAIANGALYVNKIWDHVIYRVEFDTGSFGLVTGNGYAGYDDGPTGVATIEEPNGIAANPAGDTIYFNTHRGTMGLNFPGFIVLRRLEPQE